MVELPSYFEALSASFFSFFLFPVVFHGFSGRVGVHYKALKSTEWRRFMKCLF
jgi:hypothetical protein